MAPTNPPWTEDHVVDLLACLDYLREDGITHGQREDQREKTMLRELEAHLQPRRSQAQIRRELDKLREDYATELSCWEYKVLFLRGSLCLSELDDSIRAAIKTRSKVLKKRAKKKLEDKPRTLRSRHRNPDSIDRSRRKRSEQLECNLSPKAAKRPRRQQVPEIVINTPRPRNIPPRTPKLVLSRSSTPVRFGLRTHTISHSPNPERAQIHCNHASISIDSPFKHDSAYDLATESDSSGVRSAASPVATVAQPLTTQQKREDIQKAPSAAQISQYAAMHEALLRENAFLRRKLEVLETTSISAISKHDRYERSIGTKNEEALKEHARRQNRELQKLDRRIADLRSFCSFKTSSKLNDTSASDEIYTANVQANYAKMSDAIRSFARTVPGSFPSLGDITVTPTDLSGILEKVYTGSSASDRTHIHLENPSDSIAALLCGTICDSVLQVELEAPELICTRLLGAWKQTCAALLQESDLYALDHAAHREVFDDDLFKQGFLEIEAQNHAQHFERAVLPIISGRNMGVEARVHLKSAFRLALDLKINALLDNKTYHLFRPVRGAPRNERSMYTQRASSPEEQVTGTDAGRVLLTVLPGLCYREQERKMVDKGSFGIVDMDGIDDYVVLARSMVVIE